MLTLGAQGVLAGAGFLRKLLADPAQPCQIQGNIAAEFPPLAIYFGVVEGRR